jgi:hypothetical protein
MEAWAASTRSGVLCGAAAERCRSPPILWLTTRRPDRVRFALALEHSLAV